MADGLSGQTVYVVKSGDCADADAVYGVYSSEALAEQERVRLLNERGDLEDWPGRVQVKAFTIDGEAEEGP